jgi:hypothetical protein
MLVEVGDLIRSRQSQAKHCFHSPWESEQCGLIVVVGCDPPPGDLPPSVHFPESHPPPFAAALTTETQLNLP